MTRSRMCLAWSWNFGSSDFGQIPPLAVEVVHMDIIRNIAIGGISTKQNELPIN
jgi:hypothetical protein